MSNSFLFLKLYDVEKVSIPNTLIISVNSCDSKYSVGTLEIFILYFELPNKIERIKGADHVFSAKHPWESNQLPDDLKKVIYISIDFIKSS